MAAQEAEAAVPLKLHGAAMSACTARVLTCLHEKGLDFEFVPVDLFSGEHKLPPFLSISPFGLIPVLQDGDLTLFESRAITAYIAEKYKDTGSDLLLTRHEAGPAAAAAAVKVWTEVESQHFNPAIAPIVYQYFVASMQGGSPDQAAIDGHAEKLGKVLDVYEARLEKSKYLAGDSYSLADLHHVPYTYYLMKTPVAASVVGGRPRVKAWWEDISGRPAFLKVAQGMEFVAKEK
ncbi:unnamed protein product [Linum tenue]|uniref:glutathione transferase n=1 Tax=Linum tenue TaxID=586396 RepID=A0AAV0MNJ4_9ROSI|nr:unnamed protein product [Linum tenue]